MSIRGIKFLSLVVPGGGLIVLRREWLGLALATLFCVFAQIALLGYLLVPATIPIWVKLPSGIAAFAVWGWAQWLTTLRIRATMNSDISRELAALVDRARSSMREKRIENASDLLRTALAINDEDLSANVAWAELMAETCRPEQASRAWRRVLLLAHDPETRRNAEQAIRATGTG